MTSAVRDFTLPDLGEGLEDATILQWRVAAGDDVALNQTLCEVETAKAVLPHILMFYKRFEAKRPIMLLDLQSEKIYAYPYQEFKAALSERSQGTLTTDYEKAIAQKKIVVFVRDNETRRLTSMLFNDE